EASAIKSGLPMPFTSISAGWIFTLMGLLDDGHPLNQGKSQKYYPGVFRYFSDFFAQSDVR
ncbi:hypothetical protein, partial [Thiolapillus sp.]|uniref:hypothetical protein n=1 Tax=Thiolapillus sp. TaxID=2017437 RepID=UPI003AF58E3D